MDLSGSATVSDEKPRRPVDWVAAAVDKIAAHDELEPINHPPHYGGIGNRYEAIKVIEAWDLDFCLGNAVKYISRWKEKGGVNDLKKAVWYVNRRIQQLENEHKEEA